MINHNTSEAKELAQKQAATHKWGIPEVGLLPALSDCEVWQGGPECCIFPHRHSSYTIIPILNSPTGLVQPLHLNFQYTRVCPEYSAYDCCKCSKIHSKCPC